MGYGPSAHRWHAERTATDRAAFLLPHLRSGMSLLDCGCGPGSITVGLTEVITPGRVVGIDLERRQVERAWSAARGIAGVDFAQGNVYKLPFADASFDAAFVHNVLEHLSDPLKVLKEIRRVLKPGGVAGVRDPDYSTLVWAPSTPLLEQATRLLLRIREHNGGSPYYAPRQRQLLLEAGFARCEGFAFAECQGNAGATQAFAGVVAEVLSRAATVDAALGQGWTDQASLDAMIAEVRAWGERPGAFRALLDCAAVGWI